MALQKILAEMLPEEAVSPEFGVKADMVPPSGRA
jgi:hypothetical protein